MITILVTLEDKTTIELQAEHIRLRRDEGGNLVNGTLVANGQSRFNILGWKGIAEYSDFKSDAQVDVVA